MHRILALLIVAFFSISSTAYANVDLSGKTITWAVSYTHLTLPTNREV